MDDDRIEGEEGAPSGGHAPQSEDLDRPDALGGVTTSEPAAAWGGEQDVIRSIYTARIVASPQEAAGSFEGLDTPVDVGGVLRGAYVKHLLEVKSEAVGGEDLSAGNAVRSAYVARAFEAPPSPKARPKQAKRAIRGKVASSSSAKQTVKRKAKLAAGNRAAKGAKPLATRRPASRAVARSGRAAKRPRRR